jgi:serine/threonine protein kinase
VAHERGIVHRDLKPANLFAIARSDGSPLIKILDFGIAKPAADQNVKATATGATMGTAHYMSPEQARGQKDLDHRPDIYSLGVILYELLSGKRPHEGDTAWAIVFQVLKGTPIPLEQVCPHLPEPLVRVVHRAMAFEPSDRFQTTSELAAALEPFVTASPTLVSTSPTRRSSPALPSAPPVSRTGTFAEPYVVPVHSSRRLRALLLGVGAVAVTIATTMAIRFRTAPAPHPSTALEVERPPLVVPAPSPQPLDVPPRMPAPLSPVMSPTTSSSAVRSAVAVPPAPPASAFRQASKPPPQATATAPAVPPECVQKFYLDAQGEKHFKPQCFQ